ncbi:MAG: 1-deoxy-D-xylulose-5-phosphate synthase, partial [Mameliella sp.]|nr:1-deoxy-D-xylulose-5-phosphate synthase [Mameliella sp.]
NLPGFTVMAAADEAELMHMVATAAAHDEGPIAFRYPRGAGTGVTLPERGEVLEIGRGRVLEEGEDIAILSCGAHLPQCREAAAALREAGHTVTLADARFVKPLDSDLLRRLALGHRALVTVEQGAEGGFGSVVLHALAWMGLLDRGLAIRTICLPDRIIEQASPDEMYANAAMTAGDIFEVAQGALGTRAKVTPLALAR